MHDERIGMLRSALLALLNSVGVVGVVLAKGATAVETVETVLRAKETSALPRGHWGSIACGLVGELLIRG
jgi:hypothetical protein